MNSLEGSIRENVTKGQLNAIRSGGNVPAVIYGGDSENQKISISKKKLKFLKQLTYTLWSPAGSEHNLNSLEPNGLKKSIRLDK